MANNRLRNAPIISVDKLHKIIGQKTSKESDKHLPSPQSDFPKSSSFWIFRPISLAMQ